MTTTEMASKLNSMIKATAKSLDCEIPEWVHAENKYAYESGYYKGVLEYFLEQAKTLVEMVEEG